MIGNVYRGDGFRGLLDYLSQKPGSHLLDTNLDGSSPRAFSRQVGEVRQLHPKHDLAKPVCHIPLRPAPGEDLSDEQWNEVLHLTLERMGFANSPYVAYLHDHGDGRHLHIATYRVTFEGRLVSDSNDRFRIMAVAREIERQYTLTVARSKHPIHLTRPALERLLRDKDRAKAFAAIRRAIDQAASKHDTVRSFLTELHRLGITAEIKVARQTGALQGIRFALPDGAWIKGSELGKDYSLAKICNRHELRFERRPEGRYVAASEVTAKEYQTLKDEGLSPDQVVRYGSRRTLFWELPTGHESGFVDLLAARLPHRFFHFADELPRAREISPDLSERARLVELLHELVEARPEVAPPLPAALFEGHSESAAGRSVDGAVRCQELSAALSDEIGLPPSSAAALRADYHQAMIAALSGPNSPSNASRGVPSTSTASLEIGSAQFLMRDRESGQEIREIELTQFPSPQDHPDTPNDPTAARDEETGERALVAAARYEREASLESFQEWAGLQQILRRGEAIPAAVTLTTEMAAAAIGVLAHDLQTAHGRYAADPSSENRAELSRRQTAYEALARQVESHRSHRESPPPSRWQPDLESLTTELLSAQDRHLSQPTVETEAEWRQARERYEAAVRLAPPKSPQSSTGLRNTIARESAARRELTSRLRQEEKRFLAAPHDTTARERWVEALVELRYTEGRLEAARREHLLLLERELRQSASTLAFYEDAYFRSPSPLTERLWRRAEQAHLRASLAYERARLALTAQREEPRPRRESPVVAATEEGTRLLEKQLVGKEAKPEALARRAARKLWTRTPIGQTILAAAHPLRTIAQASPASATLLKAVGTSAEVLRRSLMVYAELRAAQDRLHANRIPRNQRDLLHGDFSSRSLAAAVIRHREVVTPPVPASLPDAIRGARSSEAALLRTYRSFRKGLTAETALVSAAARALAARAAVTVKVHQALGIPSYRDFTSVLGSQEGRALSAWIGTLQRAGLSARAVATSVAQVVPTAAASTVAAIAVIGARRLVRWVADHLRTRALEILREQNEQRR